MNDPFVPITKCLFPDTPGPYSTFKHVVPKDTLEAVGATDVDFFGGRLRAAHVIRLASVYIVYSKNCLLGSGGFGDCYVGKMSTGPYVAVKRLRNFPSTKVDGKARCDALSEDMRAQEYAYATDYGGCLAPLIGLKTATKTYIIEPLAHGDALFAAQIIPKHLVVRKMLGAVLQSLVSMHARGVLHNDLKPNNIFVIKNGNDLQFQLADFGLSFSPKRDLNPGANIWYGAPEHVMDNLPGTESDVFSLGLTCMAILWGSSPFEDAWPRGKEGDVDEANQRQVYDSFEAARRGQLHPHPSNRGFLQQWHYLETRHEHSLVNVLRAMVARNDRCTIEEIKQWCDRNPFSHEEESMWIGRLKHFKIERIEQAKHQVDLVQAALRARHRLPDGETL